MGSLVPQARGPAEASEEAKFFHAAPSDETYARTESAEPDEEAWLTATGIRTVDERLNTKEAIRLVEETETMEEKLKVKQEDKLNEKVETMHEKFKMKQKDKLDEEIESLDKKLKVNQEDGQNQETDFADEKLKLKQENRINEETEMVDEKLNKRQEDKLDEENDQTWPPGRRIASLRQPHQQLQSMKVKLDLEEYCDISLETGLPTVSKLAACEQEKQHSNIYETEAGRKAVTPTWQPCRCSNRSIPPVRLSEQQYMMMSPVRCLMLKQRKELRAGGRPGPFG